MKTTLDTAFGPMTLHFYGTQEGGVYGENIVINRIAYNVRATISAWNEYQAKPEKARITDLTMSRIREDGKGDYYNTATDNARSKVRDELNKHVPAAFEREDLLSLVILEKTKEELSAADETIKNLKARLHRWEQRRTLLNTELEAGSWTTPPRLCNAPDGHRMDSGDFRPNSKKLCALPVEHPGLEHSFHYSWNEKT